MCQDSLRHEVGVEGEEETGPFDGPTEECCFEVFRLCKLATLENSHRVDDTQTPVKLSTGNIVVNALSWSQSGRERKTTVWVGAHTPIIFNGCLRHIVFAEIGLGAHHGRLSKVHQNVCG